MWRILSGFPDDVLAISASGTLGVDDYRDKLEPELAARLKAHKPLKLFIYLGPEFSGISFGAVWEDARMGLGHLRDWGDAAIVTDTAWIANAARLFAPFFRAKVRIFPDAGYDAARRWIIDKRAEAA